MKRDKVTVTHGRRGDARHPQDQPMARIATATGGRYYKVMNPKLLPAVYIKETRLVSQSFVYEKKFQPKRATPLPGGPTENLGAVPAAVRLRPHHAEAVAAGRHLHRDAGDQRPGLPGAGVLAVRPGPVGRLHQQRAPNPPARAPGTGTGPAPTCTSSSGSRSSPGHCAGESKGLDVLTGEAGDGKIRVSSHARDE